MEVGKYYKLNQEKVARVTDKEWRIALFKCKEHIKWRLKQKTFSGAHSSSKLGADALDHYLGISYEKIISGEWEWKKEFNLIEQMIRIVNSYISKEVEKATSQKGESLKIIYSDKDEQFYCVPDPPKTSIENIYNVARLKSIVTATAGDEQLEFLIEALKEGKKRAEIADLLEIGLRQFDKLKEKLIRRVKAQQGATK